MFDKAILDADFCIRLGRFEKLNFLETIIPIIAKEVYIHKYVYEDEILVPINSKNQIKRLIEKGNIVIIDENTFDTLERNIFDSTRDKLKRVMVKEEKGKNWGEVLSLSCAKVLGIPIFMSDELNLQPIIDTQLNTDISGNITVFRVKDIIEWIKNNPQCKIDRKTAKSIWLTATSDKNRVTIEESKEVFIAIWPIM